MLDFFREGGVGMLPLLVFGVLGLWAAGAFAFRPDPRRVETIKCLDKVVVFSTVTAVATDLSAVFHKVPERPEWAHSPDMPLIVMTGLGESLAPAVLGAAILTVMWLLMSFGFRRLAREA
jgi:hypothetical protein